MYTSIYSFTYMLLVIAVLLRALGSLKNQETFDACWKDLQAIEQEYLQVVKQKEPHKVVFEVFRTR